MQVIEDTTYLSLLRIIAIYWVVLIQHNFAPFHPSWAWVGNGLHYDVFVGTSNYTKYITSITMPLCFFISGFVFDRSNSLKKESLIKIFKKKVLRILIPCYLFGVIFELICENGVLGFQFLIGYKHLWFLFYLFGMFLIYCFLFRNAKTKAVLLITVFTIISYLLSLLGNSNFIKSFLQYAIYFSMGFSLSRLSYILNYIRTYQAIITIILLVFFYNRISAWGGYNIGMILMLMALLNKIDLNKLSSNNMFKVLNNTSYGVYIFHMIILYVTYVTLIGNGYEEFLINQSVWVTTVISISTLPLSIFATYFIRNLKI